jgi:hypothetical protein
VEGLKKASKSLVIVSGTISDAEGADLPRQVSERSAGLQNDTELGRFVLIHQQQDFHALEGAFRGDQAPDDGDPMTSWSINMFTVIRSHVPSSLAGQQQRSGVRVRGQVLLLPFVVCLREPPAGFLRVEQISLLQQPDECNQVCLIILQDFAQENTTNTRKQWQRRLWPTETAFPLKVLRICVFALHVKCYQCNALRL